MSTIIPTEPETIYDKIPENAGIWFVYDGECPLCRNAALALRIKRACGELHLLDARTHPDHPLIQTIKTQKIDLDDGMVIYDGHRFYHGKTALIFMARHAESKGFFNIATKALFRTNIVSAFLYPWLRGVRNFLLRRKKTGRIDNLGLRHEPIFKSVFGADWDNLPPVLQKHYANRPYTQDIVTFGGMLDVECSGPIKTLAPLLWLTGGIPPQNEKNVQVTVCFRSDEHSKSFHFDRVFHFKNRKKPYRFKSRMMQIKGREVVEIMRFGIAWCMEYLWEDGKVVLRHKGYALAALGHLIPLPLEWVTGRGHAEEIPVDENTFDMFVTITHPWWGQIYRYKGRFSIT